MISTLNPGNGIVSIEGEKVAPKNSSIIDISDVQFAWNSAVSPVLNIEKFTVEPGEAAIITVAGVVLGFVLLYGLLLILRPIIAIYFGLFIAIGAPSIAELWVLLIMCLAGTAIGFIPGYRIYRYSLADGMTIRV